MNCVRCGSEVLDAEADAGRSNPICSACALHRLKDFRNRLKAKCTACQYYGWMGWEKMQLPSAALAAYVVIVLIIVLVANSLLGVGALSGVVAGLLGALVVRPLRRYKAQCPECKDWMLLGRDDVTEAGRTDAPDRLISPRTQDWSSGQQATLAQARERLSLSDKILVALGLIALCAITAVVAYWFSRPAHAVGDIDGSNLPGVDGLSRLSAKEAFKRALDDIEKKSVRDHIASGLMDAEMVVYKDLESRETFRQALGTIANNRSVFRAGAKAEKAVADSISSLRVPESMSAPDSSRAEAIRGMATRTHDLQGLIYRDLLEVDRLVSLEGTADSTELATKAVAEIREANELATELTTLRNQVNRAMSTF